MSIHKDTDSENPYERRIGCSLFFLFLVISVFVFFLGINPRVFGFDFEDMAVARLITWTLSPALIGLGTVGLDSFRSSPTAEIHLNWWRVLIYGWSTGAIFGILMSSLPHFSLQLYLVSLTWTLIVISCAFLYRRTGKFLPRLILVSYMPSVFLILGTRLWVELIGFHWAWFIALFASYAFSWALPKLLPGLSKVLFREHYFPTTTLGRIIMRLGYLLLPIVGSSGIFGMYMHRYLGEKSSFLVLAIVSSVLSVFLAQPLSHQLFNERPFEGLLS